MNYTDFIGLHTSFVLMCILTLWYVASILFKSFAPKLSEKAPSLINAIGIITYLLFFCIHNFLYPLQALSYLEASAFLFIMTMLYESLNSTVAAIQKIKPFVFTPSIIFIGLYLYKYINPDMHSYTKFYLSHASLIVAVFIILTIFIISFLISFGIAKQSVKNLKKYIK